MVKKEVRPTDSLPNMKNKIVHQNTFCRSMYP